MAEKVRVTEAKAQLSALMARVGYGGERFVIERRGRPLAALVGVEDLARLEGEEGDAPSRPLGALALVGAWGEAEERDLDAVLGEIYAERERDTGRAVGLGA
ncbi:MAG: type II toxin-antitoxin system Phd/YefM family antitoxin [Rubrobacter sp.]|nr:type II toxin-antitoxin system Phd/YefM family antitoxin [Rubrobacter sp.]